MFAVPMSLRTGLTLYQTVDAEKMRPRPGRAGRTPEGTAAERRIPHMYDGPLLRRVGFGAGRREDPGVGRGLPAGWHPMIGLPFGERSDNSRDLKNPAPAGSRSVSARGLTGCTAREKALLTRLAAEASMRP
ncbi:hypothetical protein FMEAI12_4320046 [Parafrankia sp. Ea1.12]|nr:hypothetical protein FMEAI12_4320046 [Parafrankia sp. Ea1.12]